MSLPLSLVGWRTLWQAGVGLLVVALLALGFAFAATFAWLYTWEDTLYQLGWAAPGPAMAGVLSLETALPPAQLGPAGVALPAAPGVGGIVALGNFRWGSGSNTFCEVYVEQQTGEGNQGLTAYAAAQRMASLGLLRQGMPPTAGDVVYFGPSADNEGFGHVGIYLGGGRFRSVTFYGLADAPMAGWQAPYLGWVDPTKITTNRFGGVVSPRLGV
jgi:hypothetical protein